MTLHRRHLIAAAGASLLASPALGQTPGALPRVTLTTRLGPIILELAADRAPVTCANFLAYVSAKAFDGTDFYRSVQHDWDKTTGLIQGGLRDPAKRRPPIKHEPTSQTGLRHTDGAISMARFAPGTATSDFFIILVGADYLDAIPAKPGDSMGFAVFGKVVEGMETVRAIHASPLSPTKGEGVMKGQMLDPPVPLLTARQAV